MKLGFGPKLSYAPKPMLFLLLNTGLSQVGWMLLLQTFRVSDDLRSAGGISVSFSGHSAAPVHRLFIHGWTCQKGVKSSPEKPGLVVGHWPAFLLMGVS